MSNAMRRNAEKKDLDEALESLLKVTSEDYDSYECEVHGQILIRNDVQNPSCPFTCDKTLVKVSL